MFSNHKILFFLLTCVIQIDYTFVLASRKWKSIKRHSKASESSCSRSSLFFFLSKAFSNFSWLATVCILVALFWRFFLEIQNNLFGMIFVFYHVALTIQFKCIHDFFFCVFCFPSHYYLWCAYNFYLLSVSQCLVSYDTRHTFHQFLSAAHWNIGKRGAKETQKSHLPRVFHCQWCFTCAWINAIHLRKSFSWVPLQCGLTGWLAKMLKRSDSFK